MKRLILFGLILSAAAFAAQKPNVLFIAVDDLRPELGCYGAEHMITPNIDRLAAGGVIFERAYCNVPVCGASRASLLTGIRPTRTRFVSYLAHADKEMPDATTLPEHFKNNGYRTISIGKIFHDGKDSADAWSEPPVKFWDERGGSKGVYCAPENDDLYYVQKVKGPAYEMPNVSDSEYHDGLIVERSIEYLKQFKESGDPFFLGMGMIKPHLPFCAPKKYWDLYPEDSVELPDNYFVPTNAPRASLHTWHEMRGYKGIPKKGPLPDELAITMIRGYRACTSYADVMIGRVLDELDRLGLRENTIIVLWGDHGWNLGEHTLWCKHCTYETSLRSPLIFSVPKGLKNVSSKSLVEFVDIYPTLCELTGINLPEHLDGTSLVPVLSDPVHSMKDEVYARYYGAETIRTERFAYSEYYKDKARTKLVGRMLYDHEADPAENNNVVERPEHVELVKRLSAKLADMRAKGKM